MVPQVETVEQARHIVSAAKYGANINGTRSAPPARYLRGISDKCIDPTLTFHQNVNKQAAIIIQIESLKAIQNLDEILTAVGEDIDSVWFGTLDARVSMGLPSGYGEEPEWLDAVKLYESTLAKHNKPASGFAAGPPEIKAKLARGKSLLVITSEVSALQGTITELAHTRGNFPAMKYEGVYKKA
jgi:4-hydroxy-2-oxoheptanedioate aldolase